MSYAAEFATLVKTSGKTKDKPKDTKPALGFLAPWIVGAFFLTFIPMIVSLYLSLTKYNMLASPKFVGFQNYATLMQDQRYLHSLVVTFSYVIISVPLQLIAALALAVVLDHGMRGLTFYRSAFYLPSMLGSSVAIAVLWKMVFGSDGLFNQALGLLGMDVTQSWIANPDTANYTLMALHVWQFGSPMVIFLAGLRQIPKELYEAASVDGAGKWRQFLSITLPMLSPIIFFNLVMSIINSFQTFTQAFVVSGGTGGPNDSTLFYTLYLYMQGFGSMKMGYAAAMAWILVVIVAVLTVINFAVSKYWVHYDD
ncbi:carbohydrate ABC transporter permease [Bifidobacterium biavatii]|uniref:ABC transporter, permease protein, probably Saturated and unsaturated oligogalacturonide transporter n=1 Tax=Bifidobacterium biavatii DSM 23969 TaxID=1437608 RepID=A0A086ZWP4_9BIFI|nr:sugar ABC transporter permease [Bifidobacterium biavatii]KFI50944.1 ABC transporter, permease protein, probably Saturated and unsaturated oligogalacturonide transporter [Bifidobacterium biavatii DSM 23969]